MRAGFQAQPSVGRHGSFGGRGPQPRRRNAKLSRVIVGVDYKGPSEESQAAFRKTSLRWHDLRHEYASRLVEEGVPPAQVRDLLGGQSGGGVPRESRRALGCPVTCPLRGLMEEPPSSSCRPALDRFRIWWATIRRVPL